MADYKKITEAHPAVIPYLRARIWSRNGNTLTYRPENNTKAFSTDGLGFRHSKFKGENITVHRSLGGTLFSAVMGSSHVFGFGLPGNEHTSASRFSEKFNHAVLNISLPEANTNDLHGCLRSHVNLTDLQNLIFFPGGSFTRFCYTGLCSPLDGPPALHMMKNVGHSYTGTPDTPAMIDNLIHYQKRHIKRIAETCANADVAFYVVDEMTFFEKETPTEIEVNGDLGMAPQPQGTERFDRHKKYIGKYRKDLFDDLRTNDIKVLDFGSIEDITFIDEFHYDSPSTQVIVERLSAQIPAKP